MCWALPACWCTSPTTTTATLLCVTCAPCADPQKKKLEAAEQTFEQSGTLKALLEKSEANKAKNKREIQNKCVLLCCCSARRGGSFALPGSSMSGVAR